MNEPLSVFVCEPDESLSLVLQSWLAATAGVTSESASALHVVGTRPLDVVLFGLGPDPAHDLRAMAGIRAAAPRARIIVLHSSGQEPDVLEALRRGAWAHLCREDLDAEHLVAAVRLVARGEAPISPRVAGLILDAVQEGRLNSGPIRRAGSTERSGGAP